MLNRYQISNIIVDGASQGIVFNQSHYNTVNDGEINNSGYGIQFNSSSQNVINNLTAFNNNSGVYVYSSSANKFTNIQTGKNNNYGIDLEWGSSNNLFWNVIVSNNATGFYCNFNNGNNKLMNITAVSNSNSGINITSGTNYNNILYNISTVNNAYYGVYVGGFQKGILSNINSGNSQKGLYLYGNNNTVKDAILANNEYYGVEINSSSDNHFTGLLKVGNNGTDNCIATGPCTNCGLDSTTCANNGTSDSILTTGISLASVFIGKVTIDDIMNADDTAGTASFPADENTFDWSSFENWYRAWGIDGPALPDLSQKTRWTSGTGRIWDWSIDSGDTVSLNSLPILLIGDVANTITHTWNGGSTSTFLKNAVELPFDSVGNDDALCETDEICLYTPNIGSYQGHVSDPQTNCTTPVTVNGITYCSSGVFTDGDTLTGITLLEYDVNGR
jgi:parallel beta-helix repeat protein